MQKLYTIIIIILLLRVIKKYLFRKTIYHVLKENNTSIIL